VSAGESQSDGSEPTWVGPDYASGGALGRRLLILSAARAEGSLDLRQVGRAFEAPFTAEYISGEMKHVLWTNVARLVLGNAASRPECEAFWRGVAFSNLPLGAAWPLIERLDPDGILMLGSGSGSGFGSGSGSDDDSAAFHAARGAVPPALARAPHPASHGFEFRDWTQGVRKLLTLN